MRMGQQQSSHVIILWKFADIVVIIVVTFVEIWTIIQNIFTMSAIFIDNKSLCVGPYQILTTPDIDNCSTTIDIENMNPFQ